MSIIILSRTSTIGEFTMTLNCIDSLMLSETKSEVNFEIILIESNKDIYQSSFHYPEFVKIIIPKGKFNFNKFLNIGVISSTGSMVALCNNDLLFKEKWMSNILKLKRSHPEISSFCPIDYNSKFTKRENYKNIEQGYIVGYDVRTHITGWCIVTDRGLFDTLGLLDERFDFYYADDDYAMTLRKHNIKHALVLNSEVKHLGGMSSDRKDVSELERIKISFPDLPKYLFEPANNWILKDRKLIEGHLLFHNKWGSPRIISFKNKLSFMLKILKQDKLIKLLYHTRAPLKRF